MANVPSETTFVEETLAGRFQAVVRAGGAIFYADEPVALGGLGSGPNPYDLLASALGACTAMTLRLYAERKGWRLQRVGVRVRHVRPTPGERERFERELVIDGDFDAEQMARLLDVANRCPVHLTLERGAMVLTSVAPQGPATDPAST